MSVLFGLIPLVALVQLQMALAFSVRSKGGGSLQPETQVDKPLTEKVKSSLFEDEDGNPLEVSEDIFSSPEELLRHEHGVDHDSSHLEQRPNGELVGHNKSELVDHNEGELLDNENEVEDIENEGSNEEEGSPGEEGSNEEEGTPGDQPPEATKVARKNNKKKLKVDAETITKLMGHYLRKNKVSSEDCCKIQTRTCNELVDRYVKRCIRGDCFTIDYMELVSFPGGLRLLLPNLNQYVLARSIFQKSGAWVRVPFYNLYKRIVYRFRGNPRSLEAFNGKIMGHNLGRLGHGADNRILLEELLFKALLHYLTYAFKNPKASARCRYAFFRMFWRWANRRWVLSTFRRSAGEKSLTLGMKELKAISDSFMLLLNTSGVTDNFRLNLSYSKLVKYGMMDLMGERRVDFHMSDYMLRVPVNVAKFCQTTTTSSNSSSSNGSSSSGSSEDGECVKLVQRFVHRCEEGNCTEFDDRMLLDGKDWLNVKLPPLKQLELAFELFLNSRAKKNFLGRILRWKNKMTNSEFAQVLFDRNNRNYYYTGRDHEVIGKYLYFSVLYLRRWSLKGFLTRLFSTKTDTSLESFLSKLLNGNLVNVKKNKVSALFMAYRNYLLEYPFFRRKNREKVAEFAKKAHAMFLEFMDPEKLKEVEDKKKEEEEKRVKKEEKKRKEEERKRKSWEDALTDKESVLSEGKFDYEVENEEEYGKQKHGEDPLFFSLEE